ncbi:MAG: hypothetical protein PHE53_02990 [Thermoguttaceae bacterium]|nr:hypothetical protein [Thermoguttaceae bacterium]
MNQEINVLALVKGKERYIFLFDDDSRNRTQLFRTLRRFASCSDLSFTWYDAATLSQKLRQSPITQSNPSECAEDLDGDTIDEFNEDYSYGTGTTASFSVRRDRPKGTPEHISNEEMWSERDEPNEWWD